MGATCAPVALRASALGAHPLGGGDAGPPARGLPGHPEISGTWGWQHAGWKEPGAPQHHAERRALVAVTPTSTRRRGTPLQLEPWHLRDQVAVWSPNTTYPHPSQCPRLHEVGLSARGCPVGNARNLRTSEGGSGKQDGELGRRRNTSARGGKRRTGHTGRPDPTQRTGRVACSSRPRGRRASLGWGEGKDGRWLPLLRGF